MYDYPKLDSVHVRGYRAFKDLTAPLGPLEVIAGANGSGKSCLLEFLQFFRDSMQQDIPPEIIEGAYGRQIFHVLGPQRVAWALQVQGFAVSPLTYAGELHGPIGRVGVSSEIVHTQPRKADKSDQFLYVFEQKGRTKALAAGGEVSQEIALGRPTQLALGTIQNATTEPLYSLREYIAGWRFYSTFRLDLREMRRSVRVEQEAVLREDGRNLSAVLFYLMTEHSSTFSELQVLLRSVVPGFKSLAVKARGGPGEIIAFWEETGTESELSLADISDGILHLLCWLVLCLQPNPPGLICIDEPDLGIHPRGFALLAALFQQLSERTQVLLTTQSSYFLQQFKLEEIAVMRKEQGEIAFLKPAASKTIRDLLDEPDGWQLDYLHRSRQLEAFA